jgi:hypothetical protein
MFGRKRGPPDKTFSHSDNCKIVAADPGVSIEWSEIETGHWQAVCVCGTQNYYEPRQSRVRVDPRDPATARHLGQCEFKDVADPAVLKVLLKVRNGMGGDYWWVECGGCETAWQVPYYAEETVG